MGKKSIVKKKALVKKGGCVAHSGLRGGRFFMTRKKGGGTRREYLEKGEHIPKASPNPSNYDPREAKVGDIVEARFTHIAGNKRFPARVTKVLKNNVKVVRTDGKSVWPGDDPKREFMIQKIGTVDNGLFELKTEKGGTK